MQKNPNHLIFQEECMTNIFLRLKMLVLTLFVSVTLVSAKSYNPAGELQQVVVTGTVSDEQNTPLVGVTVMVKGTTLGILTDGSGKFTISNVPQNATLVFSFIGMTPQEIPLNGQTKVDVVMKVATLTLEEVVVVGYGVQKKQSVVGAITQTTNTELKRAGNVTNLAQAFTGQLPGVTTLTSTGEPGGSGTGSNATSIFIRGQNTWNGGQPLIMVDGLARPIDNLDVNEVESVSVLKDASATAIFGVQGANGVILITTKRGSAGKPKLTFSYNTTALTISKVPRALDSYKTLQLKNETIEREVVVNEPSWNDYTPAAILPHYKLPQTPIDRIVYPNVDWVKALFKPVSFSQHATLEVRGGTNFVSYFGSLAYLHETDMFRHYENNKGYSPSYAFDRFNFRSNLDFKLTNTTNLSVNLSGFYSLKNTNGDYLQTATGVNSKGWAAAYGFPPDVYLPQYDNGRFGISNAIPMETMSNPVAVGWTEGVIENRQTVLDSDFGLSQDLDFITKGLSAKATLFFDNTLSSSGGISDANGVGPTNNTPEMYVYANQYNGDPNQDPSQYTQLVPIAGRNQFDWYMQPWSIIQEAPITSNGGISRSLQYQFQINYARKFGLNNVGLLGLVKNQQSATDSEFPHYREDWVFRATYDYNSKYLLEMNGAYNGSEKFGPGYRFDFFPSVGLGWVVTNEKFFKIDWLNRLKLRYTIGMVGDDNVGGRWLYSSQLSYGGYSRMNANPNGTASPYTWYQETSVGNPSIHWEKAKKTNYGVDIALFNERLSATYEYFTEDRTDMLLSGGQRSTIPPYYGTTPPSANLGHVTAHGHELDVKFQQTNGSGLHYWLDFSLSHTINKILFRDDPPLQESYLGSAGFILGQTKSQIRTGFYSNWDQIYASVPQEANDKSKLPGFYNILDYNADGTITAAGDNVPTGYGGTPQNTYSTSLGADYKGFSVMVQFYGTNDVSRSLALNNFTGQTDVLYPQVLDYWSKDNQNASSYLPRWKSTGSFIGDYWLTDGSYLRLKTAEIAYTFQQKFVKKAGLSNLRIYVNGENIFFWSKLPDDRETGGSTSGVYPTPKRFNIGIDVTF